VQRAPALCGTRTRDLPVTGGKTLPLAPGGKGLHLFLRVNVYIPPESIGHKVAPGWQIQNMRTNYTDDSDLTFRIAYVLKRKKSVISCSTIHL